MVTIAKIASSPARGTASKPSARTPCENRVFRCGSVPSLGETPRAEADEVPARRDEEGAGDLATRGGERIEAVGLAGGRVYERGREQGRVVESDASALASQVVYPSSAESSRFEPRAGQVSLDEFEGVEVPFDLLRRPVVVREEGEVPRCVHNGEHEREPTRSHGHTLLDRGVSEFVPVGVKI